MKSKKLRIFFIHEVCIRDGVSAVGEYVGTFLFPWMWMDVVAWERGHVLSLAVVDHDVRHELDKALRLQLVKDDVDRENLRDHHSVVRDCWWFQGDEQSGFFKVLMTLWIHEVDRVVIHRAREHFVRSFFP